MDFSLRAAQIIDPNHGEFIIFADNLGIWALVHLLDLNNKGMQLP